MITILVTVEFGLNSIPLVALHMPMSIIFMCVYGFMLLVSQHAGKQMPYYIIRPTNYFALVWCVGLFVIFMILFFIWYGIYVCVKKPSCCSRCAALRKKKREKNLQEKLDGGEGFD